MEPTPVQILKQAHTDQPENPRHSLYIFAARAAEFLQLCVRLELLIVCWFAFVHICVSKVCEHACV